jgi:hypothetical protein
LIKYIAASIAKQCWLFCFEVSFEAKNLWNERKK